MTRGPCRTLMRSPVVKRQTRPQSGFCQFFSAVLQAKRSPPRATCSVCMAVCWCTNVTAPHPSCGSPAIKMAATERVGRVLCARETSLSPPTVLRTRGAAPLRAPVRRRGGCGAAHGTQQGRALPIQAREPASKQPRRGRAQGLWAQRRASTPGGPHGRARLPGGAQRDPVRRQARLLPSLHAGASGRARTPPPVATGQSVPGPAEAPRPSTPGPGRVCSLSGPETCGPQGWGGGTVPPWRRRPTGETPGRSAGRRCQHAGPPLPGRLGPRGQRTPQPGPAGSG